MAAPVSDLQRTTERLWAIRRLLREGAIDPIAGQTAVDLLARHPHPRIVALAGATACDLADVVVRQQEQRA